MTISIFWGDILRELRNAHNLQQIEVAKILKISRASYSNMECGRTKPSTEQIAILSEIYDVDLLNYVIKNLPNEYVAEQKEFKARISKTGSLNRKKGRVKNIQFRSNIYADRFNLSENHN